MTGHRLRFVARVMCAPLLVATLGGAAAYSGHHMGDLPDLLVRVGLMAVASLAVAHALFSRLGPYLDSGETDDTLVRHVRRLPACTAVAMFFLTVVTVGTYVGDAHGSWRSLAATQVGLFVAMILHVVLFAAYIGLFVYFLVLEHTIALRSELWARFRVAVPAGHARVAVRIVLGFAAAAAGPLLLLVVAVPEDAPPTAAAVQQALKMDLLAAGLLTVMLVFLLTRAISRPVQALLEAMERVDRGDLATQVPVISDDELGALTSRFNGMVKALAERDRVRRTFNRFVPEEVADALIADEGAIAPQEREATVLYADIEGFTRLAAELPPRDIFGLLNTHFDEVAAVIHAHGGVITQFQGDAVLAGFNLPASLREHARCAVDAAMEICARLDRQKSSRPIRMRIGLATGRVVGGTVGGGERLGYTLHGDTVNLAARLEELNKQFGSRILLDERTAELLRGAVRLGDHGGVAVRGFARPLRLFEPRPAAAHAA